MGDNSRTINSLLSIVTSNLIQGFIIIFITLIIFLDFKSAMFTSLGMIVTMFSCFIYMQVSNITFNTMSLAAIITVLGMIVDNSIVVSENIFNFKNAGYKGLEATRLAVSDVVMPMLASTLTTVAERLGIADQTWLYGPCYDERIIGEMFFNADVCLSPGNVGLTAIHALSFGCPVLTHDDFKYQNPEFEAIIPGETGDFFKKDNMADMKAKIELWINKDEESRNKP